MQMKKIISILVLTFLLLPQSFALADGVFIPFQGEDLWEPSQTALIVFDEGKENLYLKVGFEGDVNQFAWIVPTPSLPEVVMAPEILFVELHELTMPKVKYQGRGYFSDMVNEKAGGITVHSQSKVGIYDVAVLSADESGSLYDWLDVNGYNVPQEVEGLFDWYIDKKWYFTAMKIDPSAKVDMLLSELNKRLGGDVSWENAAQKITDKLFDEYISDDAKRPPLLEWLTEYDDNVYLRQNDLIFSFNEYRHDELDNNYYGLENQFKYNLKMICRIVNYDLLSNESDLAEHCEEYYRYFEEENVQDYWKEEVEAVRRSDYFSEFKNRIEKQKKYYIDKFDLIKTTDRGLIGFGHDDYNKSKGFRINKIIPGFPAEVADMKVGDYIIGIDDKDLLGLEDRSDINKALIGNAGEKNKIKVNRNGKIIEFEIVRQPNLNYLNLADRLVDKIKENLENGVMPENNGQNVENSFYEDFLLNVFKYNEDKLKTMCQRSLEDRGWSQNSGTSFYLDFNNVSCKKNIGEGLADVRVEYPDLWCSAKSQGSYKDWFDNCSYKYYYDLFNSKNKVDHWFSVNNQIEDYLERYKEEYSGDKKVNKYSDYLHPIKLTFTSEAIVYPLKISQFSTRVPESPDESPKTNEVLLYVLADKKVKAPEFRLEYANWIDESKLEGYRYEEGAIKEVLNGNNYFLTKLRRSFAKNEMDDDLYLKFEDNNETFHMEITRGADTEIDFQETKTLSESYNNNDYESNQKNFTDVKTNRVKVYYLFIFGGVIFLLAVIVVLFVFIKKRRKESTEKQELTTDEDQIQEE
jgi:hypothetical protein